MTGSLMPNLVGFGNAVPADRHFVGGCPAAAAGWLWNRNASWRCARAFAGGWLRVCSVLSNLWLDQRNQPVRRVGPVMKGWLRSMRQL